MLVLKGMNDSRIKEAIREVKNDLRYWIQRRMAEMVSGLTLQDLLS